MLSSTSDRHPNTTNPSKYSNPRPLPIEEQNQFLLTNKKPRKIPHFSTTNINHHHHESNIQIQIHRETNEGVLKQITLKPNGAEPNNCALTRMERKGEKPYSILFDILIPFVFIIELGGIKELSIQSGGFRFQTTGCCCSNCCKWCVLYSGLFGVILSEGATTASLWLDF